MEDDLRNKVILTTHRKLDVVKKLSNFMALKSTMLLSRMNPYTLKDPTHQAKVLQFLTASSAIRYMEFWKRLSDEKQRNLAKIMSLQEILEDDKKVRLGDTRETAELYVVLSGSVSVSQGSEPEVMLGPGQVFGNTEIFDQKLDEKGEPIDSDEDDEAYDSFDPNSLRLGTPGAHAKRKKKARKPGGMLATFNKGSYMRISYADYVKYVVKEEEVEDVEAVRRLDESIAGIAYENLTASDFFYINVYRRCKAMLKWDMFEFMNSYHMVPRNGKMLAHRYYLEAAAGSRNYLDPEDGLFVFVVISGSIRLEIFPMAHELIHRQHGLGCSRKGEHSLSVATRTMPLMLLQSGAMLWLQDQCFTVGHEELRELIKKNGPPDNTFDNPSLHVNDPKPQIVETKTRSGHVIERLAPVQELTRRDSTSSAGSLMSAVSAFGALDGRIPRSKRVYVPKPKPPKTDPRHGRHYHGHHPADHRKGSALEEVEDTFLYQIRMSFDQPTSYLAIPVENFDKVLDNEELIMADMAADIKAQLFYANSSVHDRIVGLLPWIMGQQDFDQPADVPRVRSASGRRSPFVETDFQPKSLEETLSAPQGSFLKPSQVGYSGPTMALSRSLSALPPVEAPASHSKIPKTFKKFPKPKKLAVTPKLMQLQASSSQRSLSSIRSDRSDSRKSLSEKVPSVKGGAASPTGKGSSSSLLQQSQQGSAGDSITFVSKMKQRVSSSFEFDKKNPLIKVSSGAMVMDDEDVDPAVN